MKSDDPNLKRQYRMPRVFGNLPGPRNVPLDKRHLRSHQTSTLLTVTALSQPAALAELLPPGCELDGEPLVSVTFTWLTNIGWLAGHGYNVITVAIPTRHHSATQGWLRGNFLPVVWENLADPILTGREELGWAKIYAEIPEPVVVGDRWRAQALWKGFRFLDLEAFSFAPAVDPAPPPAGQFHFKHVPRTGALAESDVQYLEYAPPGKPVAGYSMPPPVYRKTGSGTFNFHRARWEDVPFQYPIINALADLPLLEFRGATLMRLEAQEAIGDPSAGTLQPVE